MLTRSYGRPKEVRLRHFLSDPTVRTRFAKWTAGTMYRYSRNKRCRAAFLLDHRMGRVRG